MSVTWPSPHFFPEAVMVGLSKATCVRLLATRSSVVIGGDTTVVSGVKTRRAFLLALEPRGPLPYISPSQPWRAASGAQPQEGKSRLTSRVRQSSVTVITTLVTPGAGLRLARMLASKAAASWVKDENNSPLVPMAIVRKLALSSTTHRWLILMFQPHRGRQLVEKLSRGVPVVAPAPGGMTRSKLAPAGAVKSSTVLKVNCCAGECISVQKALPERYRPGTQHRRAQRQRQEEREREAGQVDRFHRRPPAAESRQHCRNHPD